MRAFSVSLELAALVVVEMEALVLFFSETKIHFTTAQQTNINDLPYSTVYVSSSFASIAE